MNIPLCTACSGESLGLNRNPVTSRCRDCNEDLCDACVGAHQRVKITRDHSIVRYPPSSKSLFGTTGIPSNVATSVGSPELHSEGNNAMKGLPLNNYGSSAAPSSATDGTMTGASSSSTNSPPGSSQIAPIDKASKHNPLSDVKSNPKLNQHNDPNNYNQ